MSDSPAFSLTSFRAARLVSVNLPRVRSPHSDVTALVRATLDEIRRSECALESQLCDLRQYLGRSGLAASSSSLS